MRSFKEIISSLKERLGFSKTKKLEEAKKIEEQISMNVTPLHTRDFSEELKKNTIDDVTTELTSKEIIFQVLSEKGLNDKYKQNDRAMDEIFSACKVFVDEKREGKLDIENISKDDLTDLRYVLADVVTEAGQFSMVTGKYDRVDNFGIEDNPDYRQQSGKTVTTITMPDEKGEFKKTTDQLGYISNKGNYSIGTEKYTRTVESINSDGIVMKKTISEATREDRETSSNMAGIEPIFRGVGTYDMETTMERHGDTIQLSKGDAYNKAAIITRNDTRYNESDINVPFQAMNVVDAKLQKKDPETIKQMYDELSYLYKTDVDQPQREEQKRVTAEKISKDPYGKGLEELYKKVGYKEEDFTQSMEKE